VPLSTTLPASPGDVRVVFVHACVHTTTLADTVCAQVCYLNQATTQCSSFSCTNQVSGLNGNICQGFGLGE
jgi:hypothetical protein